MENTVNEPFDNLRSKTDKSLQEERLKTDDFLNQKSQTVTDVAEEIIRKNRIAADKKREHARAEDDFDKTESRRTSNNIQSTTSDDKSLIHERKRSDEAQNMEREKEDLVHSKEQFQKRLIADSLLEGERIETDTNLLDERHNLDLVSEKKSKLLLEEKISHDLTKTNLITRDQFLAVVSHDLKNPLGSISMSAELMKSGLSSSELDVESLRSYLEIIERNATHMNRMINDLLDVERMANDKLIITTEKYDLCDLLRECRDLFSPIVKSKSFSMTIATCSTPLYAAIDHDRILQVLSNLIGNALKFTPNGGAICLSAQKHTTEIEISVTDNGPGIPEDKKSKIFDRFSQLGSNDRRGLGLGLYIAKWIVEAHKGRIWVNSTPGKGSTFSFAIPITK